MSPLELEIDIADDRLRRRATLVERSTWFVFIGLMFVPALIAKLGQVSAAVQILISVAMVAPYVGIHLLAYRIFVRPLRNELDRLRRENSQS
jgi:hypothetical protein